MKSAIIKIVILCAPLGAIMGFITYQIERSWIDIPADLQASIANIAENQSVSINSALEAIPPPAATPSYSDVPRLMAVLSVTTEPSQLTVAEKEFNLETSIQPVSASATVEFLEQTEPVSEDTPLEQNFVEEVEEVEEVKKLIIPQLDLDHSVVDVPIVNGLWDTDNLAHDIGLLEGAGRQPKDQRSMVFAGHAALMIAPIKGPFYHLDQLEIGSEIIYIKNDVQYIYRVSETTFIAPDDRSTLSNENGDQIILVTCGSYNFLTAEFDERLVVFADLAYSGPYSSQ